MEGERTVGYVVRDLATGREHPFARLAPPGIPIGRFFIAEPGIEFARAAIEHGARSSQVVFIDEVGRLELAGGGLASAVRTALLGPAVPILLVRTDFLTEVMRTFSLSRTIVHEVKTEEG